MNDIVEAADRIVQGGTKIVSFLYAGKVRNVLVGSNAALGRPRWGRMVNRAIRQYRGNDYLVGLVNNEGAPRTFKTFRVDKIEEPSFV